MAGKFGPGPNDLAPNELPQFANRGEGFSQPNGPYRVQQREGTARHALWVMLAGGVAFLVTLAVLQSLPERMYLDSYRLSGRLLWYAVALAGACALGATAILTIFKSRNAEGRNEPEPYQDVARRAVKICMFGLLFWIGWLMTLFAVALGLMYMGR